MLEELERLEAEELSLQMAVADPSFQAALLHEAKTFSGTDAKSEGARDSAGKPSAMVPTAAVEPATMPMPPPPLPPSKRPRRAEEAKARHRRLEENPFDLPARP